MNYGALVCIYRVVNEIKMATTFTREHSHIKLLNRNAAALTENVRYMLSHGSRDLSYYKLDRI